jgi:thiamine-phosphate pyrophosphorylase
MMIGVSTHNVYEARDAEAGGADFITFGPIFVVPAKVQDGAPAGVGALRVVKKHVRIPVFALGGIKTDTVMQVLQGGADGIAMISAVLAAPDIKQAATDVVSQIRGQYEVQP